VVNGGFGEDTSKGTACEWEKVFGPLCRAAGSWSTVSSGDSRLDEGDDMVLVDLAEGRMEDWLLVIVAEGVVKVMETAVWTKGLGVGLVSEAESAPLEV